MSNSECEHHDQAIKYLSVMVTNLENRLTEAESTATSVSRRADQISEYLMTAQVALQSIDSLIQDMEDD